MSGFFPHSCRILFLSPFLPFFLSAYSLSFHALGPSPCGSWSLKQPFSECYLWISSFRKGPVGPEGSGLYCRPKELESDSLEEGPWNLHFNGFPSGSSAPGS